MVDHGRVAQEREDRATAAAKRMLTRMGAKVERLDHWATGDVPGDVYLKGVNIKVRYDDVGDILIVAKADSPAGPQVAFHTDDTISECLMGFINRLENGTLQWREDKPYAERESG